MNSSSKIIYIGNFINVCFTLSLIVIVYGQNINNNVLSQYKLIQALTIFKI